MDARVLRPGRAPRRSLRTRPYSSLASILLGGSLIAFAVPGPAGAQTASQITPPTFAPPQQSRNAEPLIRREGSSTLSAGARKPQSHLVRRHRPYRSPDR